MKFPDEYFPVPDTLKEDFNFKVNQGKELCKDLNVLFCAACKDVAHVIEKSISFCHSAGENFKNYDIYLYENNSSDKTPDVIKSLKDEKITLKSEFIDNASYKRSNITNLRRCQLISNARNKYVDFINNNPVYDYVFVFDTDIEGGWSLDGIFNSIFYLENNDIMGAMTSYCVLSSAQGGDLEDNSPKNWLMFDSFAFRNYNLNDWSFPQNLHMFNYLKVKRGTDPVPVNSNFNGLAIYKPKCFKDNLYSVNNYGSDFQTDSEHVAFHRGIWKKNLKVMLNPSMITSISRHKYCKDN